MDLDVGVVSEVGFYCRIESIIEMENFNILRTSLRFTTQADFWLLFKISNVKVESQLFQVEKKQKKKLLLDYLYDNLKNHNW